MRLIEADGKELLRRAGLPVPGRARLLGPGDAVVTAAPAVAKAQVLTGGRGKAGLVQLVEADDAPGRVDAIRGQLRARGEEPLVLLEDRVAIAHEYYLAWRIDDVAQRPVLMFSLDGGVEIESHAASLRQLPVSPLRAPLPHHFVAFLRDAGVTGRMLGAIARFAADSYRVFQAEDAELLEINPLVATAAGDVVALDCKMAVDAAAAVRHPYWRALPSYRLRHAGLTALEAQAETAGVTFVELPGNVALMSGGAGLGMALVDLLADSGLAAANFCDTVGGSGMTAFTRMAELVFDRAADPRVEAIGAFFTLSATSLQPAVVSLIETIKRRRPAKPVVVGFAATGPALREMSVAQAKAAFAELGYDCVGEPSELVAALKRQIEGRA
ncbi:ATP-grasp domain-containing protein [Chelatococcus reniformis]|uniref:Succinate--CoA ligase [ADP-forming] subunit beta n=1 Tax=Chelatococcus reniformis TaxID=1494448 RepID=A0A916ULU6_9HYPH|nr:ATP-grasp domain-containing protein [Chelatococcus reniformis]GGC77971.1 succinate--CoA ligase [ADP-forming] subunit beta [Chelatococcus reniformis]